MINENEAKKNALELESFILNYRQLLNLYCILSGAYAPLTSYLGESDYHSVLDSSRLACGSLWTIPCLLDVPEKTIADYEIGQSIALRDEEGFMVAILRITEIWKADRTKELELLFKSEGKYLDELAASWMDRGAYYLTGDIEWATLPVYRDYVALRYLPEDLKEHFGRLGWRKVILYPGRVPLDCCVTASLISACKTKAANLLLAPYEYDLSKGNIDPFAAVRSHMAVLPYLPPAGSIVAKLPLSCEQGGGRELVQQAILARNYGCTGIAFAPEGLKLPISAEMIEDELGIELIPLCRHVFYLDSGEYGRDDLNGSERSLQPPMWREILKRLEWGRGLPNWLYHRSVETVLHEAFPPRKEQGVTIFFTGLSGSGKSTIANVLLTKFREFDARPVTLLDGDVVRLNLSNELGFSKKDRSVSVRRIGFVASEITKNGGIAICAPIAPYREDRNANRELISRVGGYVEVHVSTPLEVCEKRDRKGLYAKARAGIIKCFTGISDPYESPASPELSLDTSQMTPDEAVHRVLLYLQEEGYLAR